MGGLVPAVGPWSGLRQKGDRERAQDLGAAERRNIQSGGDRVEQLERDRGERKATAAAAPADPAEWHIPQSLLCPHFREMTAFFLAWPGEQSRVFYPNSTVGLTPFWHVLQLLKPTHPWACVLLLPPCLS